MTNRLLRETTRLLNASGQPYEIKSGKRHDLIFMNGTHIATISRHGPSRDTDKLKSAIRKQIANAPAE